MFFDMTRGNVVFGIFLDLETNGLDYKKHCVLEISIEILDLFSKETVGGINTVVYQTEEVFGRADPISLEINGFSYELIKGGIHMSQLQDQIIELFQNLSISRKNAVYICQNPSFDRVFFSHIVPIDVQENLLWPYHWLDLASMYWKSALQSKAYDRCLDELLPLSKDHIAKVMGVLPEAKPHRALNGTQHLIQCYEEVVGFPGKKKTINKKDRILAF